METTIEKPVSSETEKRKADSPATHGSDAIYWHKIPPAEREKIIKESKMTVAAFMEKYKQPDWCEYPDAMGGQMGCWSLVLSRSINCIKDCGDCDCINRNHQNEKADRPEATT